MMKAVLLDADADADAERHNDEFPSLTAPLSYNRVLVLESLMNIALCTQVPTIPQKLKKLELFELFLCRQSVCTSMTWQIR